MRRMLACLSVLTLATAPSGAQQAAGATAATPAALTVFLDCQDGGCDFNYLRSEITLVNWVRDRQVADLHLLVTRQETGSGGDEFTVLFLGLRQFAGLTDTMTYVETPDATDDDRRKGLARVFRLGLVRYLARTPGGARVTVSFGEGKKAEQGSGQPRDPWKNWVLRMGMNAFANGEETYNAYHLDGQFNASRITKMWKTQLGSRQNYSQDEFEIDSVTTATNIRRNFGATALHVRALGDHWSAGLRGQLSSSTYSNFKRVVHVMPAVEFDVFPYSQSTRRQVMFEYSAGIALFAYHDTTIYDKLSEQMSLGRLAVNVSSREPWGSVNVGLKAINYLSDRTKYRLETEGEFEIRLFKGFNLNFFGGYEVIHDQFALAKKNYTQQEILLRQFQRGTTYSFFGGGGFSYTFGSIYNSVVNPRFTGGFFD